MFVSVLISVESLWRNRTPKLPKQALYLRQNVHICKIQVIVVSTQTVHVRSLILEVFVGYLKCPGGQDNTHLAHIINAVKVQLCPRKLAVKGAQTFM